MDDFEARAQRAADALRAEAERLASTETVLADVIGPLTTSQAGAESRRHLFGMAAIAVAVAASAIGVAVVVVDDDEAGVVVPGTVGPTTVAVTTVPAPTPAPTTSPAADPSVTRPPEVSSPVTTPEDWVPTQPSLPDAPTVPFLALGPLDGSVEHARSGDGIAPYIQGGGSAYMQAFATPDREAHLYVSTSVPGFGYDEFVPPADPIGPWTVFADGSQLVLQHGDIEVVLQSSTLGQRELRHVAAGLGPRDDDRPGWSLQLIPVGMASIAEDYWWSGGGHSDLTYAADGSLFSELRISVGVGVGYPLVEPRFAPAVPVEVGGQPGLYGQSERGSLSALTWRTEGGELVELILAGDHSPAEMRRRAGTIREVTREDWEQLPEARGDGCQTFSC